MATEQRISSQKRESVKEDIHNALTPERFKEWYQRREFRRNIENGKPYFNGPDKVPEPELHSPSRLLQCHRKVLYQQENAPQENAAPSGIFWFGTRFEEDIIFPFLRDELTTDNTFVRNSVWMDYAIQTEVGEIQIRGATDPLIVDKESRPILSTEIKTKSSLNNLSSPSCRHKSQLHAYLYGLSNKFDVDVNDGAIIYGSRKSLDVKVFRVEFDEEFWRKTVLEWARDHSQYRLNSELPPADPIEEWECSYCDYRERCGEGDSAYSDVGTTGFLPGYVDYPKEKVIEYLQFDAKASLTPVLAHRYPELANRFSTYPWECPKCQSTFSWNSIDITTQDESQPVCPSCASEGVLAELYVSDGIPVEITKKESEAHQEKQE